MTNEHVTGPSDDPNTATKTDGSHCYPKQEYEIRTWNWTANCQPPRKYSFLSPDRVTLSYPYDSAQASKAHQVQIKKGFSAPIQTTDLIQCCASRCSQAERIFSVLR